MPVFDVAQTDPLPDREPEPLAPPSQPITGDSHRHLKAPLEELAGELGYSVRFEALEGGPTAGALAEGSRSW